MSDQPSFTDLMTELRTWPEAWAFPVRELAGRITLADARISWWFAVVGRLSAAGSSEADLDLLDAFLEQHEALHGGFDSYRRGEVPMEEFTAVLRAVAGRVEALVDSLPDPPWPDNTVTDRPPRA
ncbi:hypothetical protein AB0D08_23625 [Kitasatospora sp. NPDC048540]|uniref:hypothetical protein n=1 Tax=unclassified Kitasatospora TaxID=2633591 RepID=UPI00053AC0DA|nr:hypothetical protein [Kitasatospora sp. MBT63]